MRISPSQLAFPFNSPENASGDDGRRLWLAAVEPADWPAVGGMLPSWRGRIRHAFVSAGCGAHAVGPQDVLLLRVPHTNQFHIFVPEPVCGVWNEDRARSFRSSVENLVACRRARSTTGTGVRDLVAISFRRSGSWRPDARTGLERLLFGLRDQRVRGRRDNVAQLCRIAESSLDDSVHPALRALFRREHADALWTAPDDEGCQIERDAMRRYYDLAEQDFRACGLARQEAVTRRIRQAASDHFRAPCLPGLDFEDSGPHRNALGFGVHRIFAVPLEVDGDIGQQEPETPKLPGIHVCAGAVALDDELLLAMFNGARSRRRRLAVRSAPDRCGGVALRIGLHDELGALLGLHVVDRGGAGRCHFDLSSPTISFSEQSFWLPDGQSKSITGIPMREGTHRLLLNALTEHGESVSLRFCLTHPQAGITEHV